VIAGVLPQALQALKHLGVKDATQCVAAFGPCISVEAFEVGEEVAAEFDRVFGGNAPVLRQAGKKPHIDLQQALVLQLLAAGLSLDQIDQTDRCTFRDREEFFSHRRDKGVTGRLAAVIGARF
jgi:polyphenol oxidase